MTFRERIERTRLAQDSISVNDTTPANDNADMLINSDLKELEPIQSEFYGIEHSRNHIACLDLRFKDGSRKALPYSYILEITFDASDGIEIFTSTRKIQITGRDLELLYDYLIAYRLRYIQANLGTDINEPGLFVDNITLSEF